MQTNRLRASECIILIFIIEIPNNVEGGLTLKAPPHDGMVLIRWPLITANRQEALVLDWIQNPQDQSNPFVNSYIKALLLHLFFPSSLITDDFPTTPLIYIKPKRRE